MPGMSLPAISDAPARPILVGFSGGLDSTVLLHWLCTQSETRKHGLRAIHVHHGLHRDADAWAEHCRNVCRALDIELTVVEVSVPRDSGLGLEAAARQARHRAFAAHLHEDETLALGHHQDDQAETVLLRLLRASGSEGLAAIRPVRKFGQGSLWRPLLEIPRSTLLHYAQSQNLHWIEDPSNAEEHIDRNFLRHRVLPLLAERWPAANAALSRSAALLAEDAELLRAEASVRLAQVQGLDESTLSVAALLALDKPWRSRVLRLWLTELGLPPLPGQAFEIIESQLLLARPDAQPQYQWADTTLQRWRDLLHVEITQPGLPSDWHCRWDGTHTLTLPTGDTLDFAPAVGAMAIATGDGDCPNPLFPFERPFWQADKRKVATVEVGLVATPIAPTAVNSIAPTTAFVVRARQGGERITLPGRDHSHSLKHVLQTLAVPPWERERLPLLFAEDGQLLAAGDLVLSARLDEMCRQYKTRLLWQRK